MAKKSKGKRANGEGSIIQRKDGRWCGVVFVGNNLDGTPQRKYVYGKTQADVVRKMSDIKHRLITTTDNRYDALLGETMKDWLRIYKKPLVSSRTFEHNVRIFKNHILPALGEMRICDINTNIVQSLLTKIYEDHDGSPNTPKKTKFLLNQFFEYLINEGLVRENPTMRCKISSKRKKTFIDSKGRVKDRDNYKAIPQSERAKFIKALDLAHPLLKPLCLVMMLASLRVGEALALEWSNIDFEKGALYVEQGLTKEVEIDDDLNIINSRSIISSTKTSCSKRGIKMPKLVSDALLTWKNYQKSKGDMLGVKLTQPHSLIFCNDDGSIRGYDATRRMFDRFTKKHGFKDNFGIHCHMLRQTYSNMQFENNRNIKKIQQSLGHKDAKTTQLHYNSIIDQELDLEGAMLMDSLFSEKDGNETEIGNNNNYEYNQPEPVQSYSYEEQSTHIKTTEELEIEMLQKMLEMKQQQLREKKKRDKDFEM